MPAAGAAGSARLNSEFSLQTVLIVFHLMVVIALVVVVLLQRSEGGALGIGGGGGFMTGRGQANILTRATAILAALFFATSLALTIIANLNRAPRSIFEGAQPANQGAPAAPGQAPAGGNLLDQLKQFDQRGATSAPGGPPPAGSAAPAGTSSPAAPAAPTSPEPPRQ